MQKLYNDKDGIAHLLKDHESFRKLFDRFHESSNNVERLHIVDQIVLEVSQHASAEERYVYPLIMTRIDQGKYQIHLLLLLLIIFTKKNIYILI